MAADAWYGGPAGGCWRHHSRGLIAAGSVPCGIPSYTHAHSHMMPLSQIDVIHSTAVPSRQPGTQILLWSCSVILVIGGGSSLPGLGLLQQAYLQRPCCLLVRVRLPHAALFDACVRHCAATEGQELRPDGLHESG